MRCLGERLGDRARSRGRWRRLRWGWPHLVLLALCWCLGFSVAMAESGLPQDGANSSHPFRLGVTGATVRQSGDSTSGTRVRESSALTDVPTDHWLYDAVSSLTQTGLLREAGIAPSTGNGGAKQEDRPVELLDSVSRYELALWTAKALRQLTAEVALGSGERPGELESFRLRVDPTLNKGKKEPQLHGVALRKLLAKHAVVQPLAESAARALSALAVELRPELISLGVAPETLADVGGGEAVKLTQAHDVGQADFRDRWQLDSAWPEAALGGVPIRTSASRVLDVIESKEELSLPTLVNAQPELLGTRETVTGNLVLGAPDQQVDLDTLRALGAGHVASPPPGKPLAVTGEESGDVAGVRGSRDVTERTRLFGELQLSERSEGAANVEGPETIGAEANAGMEWKLSNQVNVNATVSVGNLARELRWVTGVGVDYSLGPHTSLAGGFRLVNFEALTLGGKRSKEAAAQLQIRF